MFDIGFFELLIVGIVGLVVIGPERLPETVRTVALWFGRFKQTISETRTELEKQVGADEIRRQLHNERIMKQLRDTRDDINRTVNDTINTATTATTTATTTASTSTQPAEANVEIENSILPKPAATESTVDASTNPAPADEKHPS